MATEFLTLLQRDHHDLALGLAELIEATSIAHIRVALDGVRLGLTAHAEAEDIVLYQALASCGHAGYLQPLIGAARAGHAQQEGALAALVCTRPGTDGWRERAGRLRQLVLEHAQWEEQHVVAPLRELAPAAYARLAGAFATERLRQLAMLQPSAPIDVSGLAAAS